VKRLAVGLLFVACSSTQRSTQAQAANAVARASNDLQPVLLEAYRSENEACIAKAQSMAEGKACFLEVDARFDSTFRARRALAIAQDAWADELERTGGTTADTARRLVAAWCELARVAPKSVAVPSVGIRCDG
jgi:hypothetical protein